MVHIHFRWGAVYLWGWTMVGMLACDSGLPLDDMSMLDSGVPPNSDMESDANTAMQQETWHAVVKTQADTPDLQDATVDLFVPATAGTIRGAVVFSHVGVGDWEFDNSVWRTFAAIRGYALLRIAVGDIHDRVTPWESPAQSATLITRIFDTMAVQAGRPTLRDCPLVFWGHSAGGFWITRFIPYFVDRTAGFVAFHGSLSSDEMYATDTLEIPGLFLIGEYDPIWIRDGATEHVRIGRENGARWALVVEPNAKHWDVDPGRWLMISFTETVFERRLADTADLTQGLSLATLPESDGWIGHVAHKSVYDGDEEFPDSGREIIESADIAPWGTVTDTVGSESWLISESFAHSWLSYERLGI